MKTGKDLSTLFREGSDSLRLQPSGQAWGKLEGRLERQRQGRVVMMRWVAAVAAMLVLVGGVYFWSLPMKQSPFALLDAAPPLFMEELVNKNGCEPFCLVLQARKELPAYYAHPVQK